MGTVTFDEETGVEVTPQSRREARQAEAPAPRERKPFDYKRGFWIAVGIFGLYIFGADKDATPTPTTAPVAPVAPVGPVEPVAPVTVQVAP